jgi:hypothetical protein
MNRTLVASTNLRSIGYDAASMTLEIEFNDGGVYQYSRVPEGVYNSLMGAVSKGAFFHAHVKDRYPTYRVR